jgi:predicted nucleotidyltransferase/biotin operon repressor
MPSKSKENRILELFLNSSMKQWHFDEIVRKTGMSRSIVLKWLDRLRKEGIIKKAKEKGKMPYFISDFENPGYKNKKRLYSLERFYETGFLNHLTSLKKAKAVILFGSFARSDWYKDSDIDVFIYGDDEGFSPYYYQSKLKRTIQCFVVKDKEDINKFTPDFIQNLANGYIVKGRLDFLRVGS